MTTANPLTHRFILGMRVDATSYQDATARILAWAREDTGRYVCAANVHMTMETHDAPAFREVVNGASLVTPDGMPLVWLLRRAGLPQQSRVYGPTLMLHACEAAAAAGVPIGLYGAKPEVLGQLKASLERRFPDLAIPYAVSPPFRALTPAEDAATLRDIRASGARILFVGLGCPRQEQWMAARRERLPLVMVGVGAAFDFHAGAVQQAPAWLQNIGLEWAYRLLREPRRLGGRYLKHNPRFVRLVLTERLLKPSRR